jgi:MFS family permease
MNDKDSAFTCTDSAAISNDRSLGCSQSPVTLAEKPIDATGNSGPEYCVFLYALDTTVVADIQPNIIASLGDFQKFPWLATAYALPSTALVLIQSKMYGIFDIKWLYFGYVVCFEIGSAISGASPTMNSLIVGRMIAGIGGCGIYVGSLTFFSVVTTPKERPLYIAMISPTWGIGTVLGPIVSLSRPIDRITCA